MVARSLHLVQGPQGVPTSAAQCRYLTVDLLTGICLVGAAVNSWAQMSAPCMQDLKLRWKEFQTGSSEPMLSILLRCHSWH